MTEILQVLGFAICLAIAGQLIADAFIDLGSAI